MQIHSPFWIQDHCVCSQLLHASGWYLRLTLPKLQITFHWNGLVENLRLFSPSKCTVLCELPYVLYTVYCPFMTLRFIFYHHFLSFSFFSLSLSVVSIKYINKKIINAEKFCSNKCSLYKPTMGKIEGVFLVCFF